MKKIIVLLICIFLLIGCQRWVMTKDDIPYNQTSDWSKDQRECKYEAEKVATTHSYWVDNVVSYGSVYNSCMEYKGWSKTYIND